MPDNSTIKGRFHTSAHIQSFQHPSRWPYWYRLKKPDNFRSGTKTHNYEIINAKIDPTLTDSQVQNLIPHDHHFTRVEDTPDHFELIGQCPIIVHSIRTESVEDLEMNVKVTRARGTVPWDYRAECGDHIIELSEDVPTANGREWNVDSVEEQSSGQFWSLDLTLMLVQRG